MSKRRSGLVALIGVFKLIKGAALLALGIGVLVEMPDRLAGDVEQVVAWIGLITGRAAVDRAIGKLWGLDPSVARWAGLLALAYAAVFLVEGVGLVLEKRWAEWMTVVVTASFIPFELYELFRHFGPGKVIVPVLNTVIVAYLARRRLEERGGPRRDAAKPARTGGPARA